MVAHFEIHHGDLLQPLWKSGVEQEFISLGMPTLPVNSVAAILPTDLSSRVKIRPWHASPC
jgi:hypothetical protein